MTETATLQHTGHFLLERVSPAVRKLLMKERILAMGGQIAAVLQSLAAASALVTEDRPRDRVALGLLHAELLHLDERHGDALGIMQREVMPLSPALSADERFGLEQNLIDLQFASRTPSGDAFYNVVDRKRLVKFEWLDYGDLFGAKQQAERGKHFETLPVLWQQLRRAYAQGCWAARRWMSALFARECCHLHHWDQAVHHFLLAEDDTLRADIAGGIIATRRADLIDRIVHRLLTTANLRAHSLLACQLLTALADAIPDARIPWVGEWLLQRAAEVPAQTGLGLVHAAWEAIGAIATRFSIDLARRIAAVAVAHPVWTTKPDKPNAIILERQQVVRSLVPVAWTLPPGELPALAAAALPLLTERPQVSDYDDVVNLLCHLANRGGTEIKELVAQRLYPAGQGVPAILVQVADIFGKGEAIAPGQLKSLADRVAAEIRKQVQWLEGDAAAQPAAEEVSVLTCQKEGRTLKVYITGFTMLHAVVRHRARLDEPTLTHVVDAILEVACNKDNFCCNREALLSVLVDLADVIPPPQRPVIEAALKPLAAGEVPESSYYPTAAETDHPLSRIRHHVGRPEDVQAMSMIALAAVLSGDEAGRKRVVRLLEAALCDHRPGIRRAAYAAARRINVASEGVILGVLAGLRDPDPSAAMAAFAALVDQTGWKLKRHHWRVFLMAVRLAQRTGNAKLREHAAAALVAWVPACPRPFVRERDELLAALGQDVCWSVRARLRPQE